MFLGAAVFFIIATALALLALRAIRTLLNKPFGRKKDKKEDDVKEKKGSKKEDKNPSEAEAQKESLENTAEEVVVPEETQQRITASIRIGIGESFPTEGNDYRIDGKALADACVSGGMLSYLEYNNRALAGEGFHGFNLIVQDGERMVLTYDGSAVASLTVIEREATAIINGETVKGTEPAYRINTFPPVLKRGTIIADVEKMLSASERIRGLERPEQVANEMVDIFMEGENVEKLKLSIDGKIQRKESTIKESSSKRQSKPRRLR